MQMIRMFEQKIEAILSSQGGKPLRLSYHWGGPGTYLFRLSLMSLLFLVCLAACAPGSGIFAGGNWQSGGLQKQHIHTLEVDPNNSQDIYAGDLQNGVFFSSDAGAHWSQHSVGLPLPTTVHVLAFDDSGKKLYAGTDAGAFVSTHAAQHWIAVGGLPTDSYTALAFDLKASHTIYIGSLRHGVFVSTNDGSSWIAANGGLPTGITINGLIFDSGQHQLWAATNLGVYRSINAGGTWQALNNGLPGGVIVNAVLPAATSGGDQDLVFAGTNQGFFRSQDDGAHWSASQEALSGTTVYSILIDYRKVTTVYIGFNSGVLRSDDNGQYWQGVASGLPRGQAVYALVLGADGYNQLYAAGNDVYLFPGSSSGFDLTRIIPLLFILFFFYLLYRLATRKRGHSRKTLRPEQVIEASSPVDVPMDALKVNAPEKARTNNVYPVSQTPDVSAEGEERKKE